MEASQRLFPSVCLNAKKGSKVITPKHRAIDISIGHRPMKTAIWFAYAKKGLKIESLLSYPN